MSTPDKRKGASAARLAAAQAKDRQARANATYARLGDALRNGEQATAHALFVEGAQILKPAGSER